MDNTCTHGHKGQDGCHSCELEEIITALKANNSSCVKIIDSLQADNTQLQNKVICQTLAFRERIAELKAEILELRRMLKPLYSDSVIDTCTKGV